MKYKYSFSHFLKFSYDVTKCDFPPKNANLCKAMTSNLYKARECMTNSGSARSHFRTFLCKI
jgi:hypothetical protein